MEHFKKIIPFCLAVLCIFQSCNTNEQSKKEIVAENQSANKQISLVQNALDNLVKSISGGTAIKTDTAATVTRLDSINEKDREAATIKFRLGVLEESINNLSKGLSNKILSANDSNDCHWELVGYYSCNCVPNPGGTIHCDLCPIYKWVCSLQSQQSDSITSSAKQYKFFLSPDGKTINNNAGVVVAKLIEAYEAVAPDVSTMNACPPGKSWTCIRTERHYELVCVEKVGGICLKEKVVSWLVCAAYDCR